MGKQPRRGASAEFHACLAGALAASTACAGFMAAVYVLDINGIATLAAASDDTLPWGALLRTLLAVALVGFVTGPSIAGGGSDHE